jgi:hypothetical protein
VVVYDQPSARLQAGARELSYSPKPPQNAKSLISRIENFLMNFRDERFASFLYCRWKVSQRRRFVLFKSRFLEGRRDSGANGAYVAIAPPENSPLKKPIDRALMRITGSPDGAR